MSECEDYYDMVSEAREYQSKSENLVDMMMDQAKYLNQHHIKIDFDLVEGGNRVILRNLAGHIIPSHEGGVLPVFQPHVNTYGNGIYAFSLHRSRTVYVGANQPDNFRNNVYDRVIRFGRSIHYREYESETHSAGKKYRNLYGSDTSNLYLSFLLYNQFTDPMTDLMHELRLDYSDIETILIRKFSSKYLLNTIGR